MTPADYLSWLPENPQPPAQQDDIYSTLWTSFSGNILPDLGFDVGDDTWTASGYVGDGSESALLPNNQDLNAWFQP